MKDKLTGTLGGLKDCWVAGGAITSLYTNKTINDFDIYPKTEKAMEDAISWCFESGYWNVHASSRALTFASGDDIKIQIMIFDTFETSKKIFKTFDFTVCMGAFDLDTEKFTLHKDFLMHCSQRFLKFNPDTRFPYASAWRVRKYEERGYTIGKMEYFKILLACQNKPVTSWEELKDQIGGVYGESLIIPEDTKYSFKAGLNAISTMAPSDVISGYESAEAAIISLSNRTIPYYKTKNGKYKANLYYDDNDTAILMKDRFDDIPHPPKNGKLVTMRELFPSLTFYKKVKVDDSGVFRSINYPAFVYTVGKYVKSEHPYIFCYDTQEEAKRHWNTSKSAIVELVVDDENHINFDGRQITLKQAFVKSATVIT